MEASARPDAGSKGGKVGVAGGTLGIALLGGAVITELRKPRKRRRWHGTLLGVIPYDLRPPTRKRLRATFWNPRGSLFTPQLVGVGWTLNVGRVLRLLRRR